MPSDPARPLAVRAPLALASIALAAGCGSELDAASAPSADAASIREAQALSLLDEAFCEPFADHLCEAAERCACTMVPGFPSDCQALAKAQCRLDLENQIRAVGPSFLASTDGVAHCLDALDADFAACEAPDASRIAAECRLVTAPDGASLPRAGEVCTNLRVCARGLRCGSGSLCAPPHPAGASCLSELDCEWGLVCSQVCDPGPCHMACAPRVPAEDRGFVCGGSSGAGCAQGSVCAQSVRTTCQELGGSGNQCFSDQECPAGAFCGGFEAVPTCQPLPVRGEPCAFGIRCADGLACRDDGLCGSAPGLGEPCARGMSGGVCADGLACRVDGLCGRPGGLSELCNLGVSSSCEAGLVCDLDALGVLRCGPTRKVGEACQVEGTCAAGLTCDFASGGSCQPLHAEGERCSDGRACAEGLACVAALTPTDLRCGRVDGVGDACSGSCPRGLACMAASPEGRCAARVCVAIVF